MPNVVDLAAVQQALDEQPFSVLLGARVSEYGDGRAALELDIRDELRQQYGFVHGGVLAYLADNALTLAAATATGPGLITAGFTIDYLRPALGVLLRAQAWVVRAGRTRLVCRCDVSTVDESGKVTQCAAAQGNIAVAEHRPAGKP